MKHLTPLILLALLCINAKASPDVLTQYGEVLNDHIHCSSFSVIPQPLTYGEPKIISSNGTVKISECWIYDKNFHEVKHISFPGGKAISIGYYRLIRDDNSIEDFTGIDYEGDRYGIQLTQTFFNNDEKFEYIIPKTIKNENHAPGYYDEVYEGLNIFSDDGSIVYSVKFPKFYVDISSIEAWTIHGKNYLSVCNKFDIYPNTVNSQYVLYDTYIYEVNRESNELRQVMVKESPMRVSQQNGSDRFVKVELDPEENFDHVQIVDMNGRTIMSRPLGEGESETMLDTSRLTPGTYVVVADNGTTRREACKIIIR